MVLAGPYFVMLAFCFVNVDSITLKGNSTFNIGGIFNFYETKTPKNSKDKGEVNAQFGIMMYEAMRYAVRKVNEDPSIMLGFQLAATTRDGTDSLQQIEDIVFGFARGQMTFAAGPLINQDAFTLSIVSSSIDYPLISYYASFDGIDTSINKTFFFRTVPTDAFRTRATLQLVRKMGWNYVSVISSFDKNGERMAKLFVDNLKSINACLGEFKILPETPKRYQYDEAVTYTAANKRVGVLILFTYFRDTVEVLKSLERHNLTNRFYILAASGISNYHEIIHGVEHVVEGALSIEFKNYPVPGFRDYFLNLTPTTCQCDKSYQRLFDKFWQRTFNCKLPSSTDGNDKRAPCTGKERLTEGRGYYPNTPVYAMVDAVYALAQSLKDFINVACGNKTLPHDPCLIDARRSFYYVGWMRKRIVPVAFRDGTLNLSAPFAKHDTGIVEYEIHNLAQAGHGYSATHGYTTRQVGNWSYVRTNINVTGMDFFYTGQEGMLSLDERIIDWGKGRPKRPESLCSRPCGPGYHFVRDRHLGRSLCCWDCRPCPGNNIVFNNTCVDCGFTGHPNLERTKCEKLPQTYLGVDDNIYAQIFMAVTILGLLATICLAALFLKNNDHKVVKATGRDLCYFIMFGIFMTFFTPVLFLIRPSVYVCALRGIFPGLAFCMCYAPLFLKTNRIYRIFHHAQISVSRPPLVSPQAQVVILFGIFAIQGLLGSIWLVSKPPQATPVVSEDRQYIVEQCENDVFPLTLNLSVSVVLMVACTWQAFKTRNFPKNFNEAKYIGFTMYLTCIFWAVFLPTYFITKKEQKFLREFLMCSVCILIGYVTLIGLFGQKVKLLMIPARVELHTTEGQTVHTSFPFKTEKKKMKSVKLGVLNENCDESTIGIKSSVSTCSVRSDMSNRS